MARLACPTQCFFASPAPSIAVQIVMQLEGIAQQLDLTFKAATPPSSSFPQVSGAYTRKVTPAHMHVRVPVRARRHGYT